MTQLSRWLAFVVHGRRLPVPRTTARRGPARNSEYRAWVRTKPCLVCGSERGVEACHTGPHGLSMKSSDFQCIPLCYRHHRTGNDALDKIGPRQFQQLHRVDVPAAVRELNFEWFQTWLGNLRPRG